MKPRVVRVQRAIAGEVPLSDLTDDERRVAFAAINAAISSAANESSFADRLAARGTTTVVMDDEGQMVRRHPDGSTVRLRASTSVDDHGPDG
jgi:hypothetical protein